MSFTLTTVRREQGFAGQVDITLDDPREVIIRQNNRIASGEAGVLNIQVNNGPSDLIVEFVLLYDFDHPGDFPGDEPFRQVEHRGGLFIGQPSAICSVSWACSEDLEIVLGRIRSISI